MEGVTLSGACGWRAISGKGCLGERSEDPTEDEQHEAETLRHSQFLSVMNPQSHQTVKMGRRVLEDASGRKRHFAIR